MSVPVIDRVEQAREVSFPVTGMTCASCVRRIEKPQLPRGCSRGQCQPGDGKSACAVRRRRRRFHRTQRGGRKGRVRRRPGATDRRATRGRSANRARARTGAGAGARAPDRDRPAAALLDSGAPSRSRHDGADVHPIAAGRHGRLDARTAGRRNARAVLGGKQLLPRRLGGGEARQHEHEHEHAGSTRHTRGLGV